MSENPLIARSSNVHTMLFFDDWFVHSYKGLNRLWKKPRPAGRSYTDPYSQYGAGMCSVEYHRESRLWRAWHDVPRPDRQDTPEIGVGSFVLLLWVSEDGVHWRPFREGETGIEVDPGRAETWPHVVCAQTCGGGGRVYFDARETDPDRRYKMAFNVLEGDDPAGLGCMGKTYGLHLATSKDGVQWRLEHCIHPTASDTTHSIVYNPTRERYQMTMRASSPDRRVWLMESRNTRDWEDPILILHGDPADPPSVQLYGMPHYYYEGYYIGLPWYLHTTYDERGFSKGCGVVDTHLAYSLNGIAWSRTDRRPFIGRGEPGEPNFGCVYACAMVEAPEGDLCFYAWEYPMPHGREGDGKAHLAPYRLRKDGFVCLAPEGYRGQLTTCAIIPEEERLSINARAPNGQIRVEVLDQSETPIHEYCGDNAACFTGDDTAWQVRWPQASLAALRGRIIKLRLTIVAGELYAIRFSGFIANSYWALKSLDGTAVGPTLLPADPAQLTQILNDAWDETKN